MTSECSTYAHTHTLSCSTLTLLLCTACSHAHDCPLFEAFRRAVATADKQMLPRQLSYYCMRVCVCIHFFSVEIRDLAIALIRV